ncbi:MAG TPA: choice-of-anchor Q domain-containing protein [Verrucomicrobiae bacterium]|nr:choice-of-anchor Q domain-containing protein [Verrucomicrobiae bacterium]
MKTLKALLLLLGYTALHYIAPASRAATVTNCDEASLRAAMSSGGIVIFSCDGTITLSNSLFITVNTELDASGHQIVLDGGKSVRLFEVVGGASLSLNHLVLANGKSTNGGAVYNQGAFEAVDCTFTSNTVVGLFIEVPAGPIVAVIPGEGGAVWNGASTVLRRCKFNGNRAAGFSSHWAVDRGAYGGAVCNRGQLFISDCVFASNTALGGNAIGPIFVPDWGGDGKGGSIYNGQSAVVLNSTFVGNSALGGAGSPASRELFIPQGGNGGTAAGGAICSQGMLAVTNSTLYGNQAIEGLGGSPWQGVPGGNPGQSLGGGVAQTGGGADLAFCTVAANSAINGGELYAVNTTAIRLSHTVLAYSPLGGNGFGPIQDLGYNLSSDASLILTNTGSISMIDPMLGPLANNGGLTPTLALVPGSPAIDAGASVVDPVTDQRGFTRPVGARSDIGALENSWLPLSITNEFIPDATNVASVASLETTISNPNDIPFTGLRLTNTLSTSLSVATGSVTTTGFDGIVAAVPGSHVIVLSGFSLPPATSCTIRVPVAADAVGVGTSTVTSLQSDHFGRQSLALTASVAVSGPPDGHTDAATGADLTSVTLHGTINPGGAPSLAWFEYGTTANFGQATPVQALPAGLAELPVSALVTGLPPRTDFFFRSVASNAFGTFLGNTLTFFTLGDVAVCDEAHLRANLARGGTVRIVCDGSIVLSNTLSFSTDTEIDATGRQVVFSGNDAVRVIDVAPGVSLTLRGLNITRGRSTNGAGIYNDGTLLLDRCLLTANHAFGQPGLAGTNGFSAGSHPPNPPSAGQPGGPGGVGNAASGGGLLNRGACTILWTTIASNSVTGGVGGTGGQAGYPNFSPGNLTPGGEGGGGGAGAGGAIFNTGELVLSNCCVFGNRATGGLGGSGGANYPAFFHNVGGAGGTAVGAGIRNEHSLTMLNVTVADNEVIGGAGGGTVGYSPANGGDGIGGGISTATFVGMTNCTIAANKASGGNGATNNPGFPSTSTNGIGLGGGLVTTGAAALLKNVLLAHAPSNSNCFGPLIDAGNNLSSDASCPFTADTSLSNTDPRIGPLADNGGPTPTMALLPFSPAIDSGDSSACPSTDQRGRPRPALAGCDIGAYEVQPDFFGLRSFRSVGPQTFRMSGIGLPGASFRVVVSEDFVLWVPAASGTVRIDGLFDVDLPVSGANQQFFRTVSP